MSKGNDAKIRKKPWTDHPLFGKSLKFKDSAGLFDAVVVDVKRGPMLIDTSTFDQPEAKIEGTIKLQIKRADTGAVSWTPPLVYQPEKTP